LNAGVNINLLLERCRNTIKFSLNLITEEIDMEHKERYVWPKKI
jgi:hypothetical protein